MGAIVTIANEWVDGTWHAILAVLIGIMWIGLGLTVFYNAFVRNRRVYNQQRKHLERVIASGSREDAAKASSALGVLLAINRDWDGARAAFQRAIDSGAPDTIATASFNLGLMHHSAGHLEAAFAKKSLAKLQEGQHTVDGLLAK